MTKDKRITKSKNVDENDDWFWVDDATAFVGEEPPTKSVYDLHLIFKI